MSFPEQDRAVQILEKEFGPRWKQIVQELGTKELRQRVGITRDEAVTRLGRLDYLSGIARSAFHFTAMRITEDGKVILFDSSRLFGKE